jgi:zinc protease
VHGIAVARAADAVVVPDEAVTGKTLDNGLVVFAKRVGHQGLAAIDVKVMAGSSLEGRFLGSGISHLLEHMVFKGTSKRPPGAIEREAKSYGGIINGSASQDLTSYYLLVPSEHLKGGLALMKDMIANPSLDSRELEKENGVVLREIALNDDEPMSRMMKALNEKAYLRHSYKYPTIGYAARLKALTRDDLIKYHETMYVPNRMVVTIVSDVDEADAISMVEEAFKDIGRANYEPPPEGPAEPPQISARRSEIDMKASLAYLAMGFHSTDALSDDIYAMDVLSIILGRGEESRLNRSLVEEMNIAHSATAWNHTPMYPGLFVITAISDKDKAKRVESAVRDEIEAIVSGGVSDDELASALRMTVADHIASLETVDSQADDIGSSYMLTGDPAFLRKYVDRVQAVSGEDVRRVAAKYLSDANSTIVRLPLPEADEEAASASSASQAPDTIQRDILPNGIRVLAHRDAKAPSVAVTVAMLGGLMAEEGIDSGVSNMTSRSLLAGTSNRSRVEIVGRIESLGGSIEPFSGFNSFGLNVNVLKPDLDTALDILSDILENSEFPQKGVDLERDLTIALIKKEDDDIFDSGLNALRRELFASTPYASRITGSSESVSGLTREDLITFYREHVEPGNIVISIAGDIDHETALAGVRRRFSGIKGRAPKPSAWPRMKAAARKTVRIDMDKDQSLVLMGFVTAGLEDPRRYAIDVISSIMSGQSGRIFDELRNRRGLAYALGCVHKPALGEGFVVCYIACSKDKVPEARAAIAEELRKIRRYGVTPEDLRLAKNELVSARSVMRQSNEFNAINAALDEIYGLGHLNIYKYAPRIEMVTAEDVKSAAQAFLDPDNCVTIEISPG